MEPGIWISWEKQRRTVELAKILGCRLHILEYCGWLRYPKCLVATMSFLLHNRSRLVFVQNPSMILAAVACLHKMLSRSIVIVDRHSTFRFKSEKGKQLKFLAYKFLNWFTLRFADITVVTNQDLAAVVESSGGRPYVLPDRIPEFPAVPPSRLAGAFNILFVCSYARDEPVEEVIEAMRDHVDSGVTVYISGNCNKLDPGIRRGAPVNVRFTGFLAETEYVSLLHAVDAVMVLTTSDHTMMCGCYEAIAASKPLLTSDKKVLREYFQGSLFVENNRRSIAEGIAELLQEHERYARNSCLLRNRIDREWVKRFNGLLSKIDSLSGVPDYISPNKTRQTL